MEEKDWIILKTLYEERNITKAAERLYISQPALTYRLQQLEKEFETKIVLRGKKGVEFTPEGEYLVEYANQMISKLRNVKEYIANMNNKVKGTLRLGVSGIYARYKLPIILKKFLSHYPNVDINLKTGWSVEIPPMLHKEEVHLGIVRGNYDWQGQKYLLHKETICIAAKEELVLEELPMLPRINYETDITLKTLIDHWWQKTFSHPPTITMEVDQMDTCKAMVRNGLGYAILPGICLLDEDDFFTMPIRSADGTPLTRDTWLLYRDTSLELTFVKSFIEFLLSESQSNSRGD
ncbi:LysR family transcriptional regulator [Thermoactinomyces sp. CICC 10735]|uniref:LysR family transcriptional regulator n=1 Tax=Thermoactinomyces sp. CICC 10735 TaxID=2767430 RepID=UPI0018DBBB63|nr:LysR family transcriptional regulator [Thermoactinomyces sp. CICC 10735]MBH8582475.1 LysR family transcriptional regulator [Thermoactinomyces sp. CICC 10735]